MADVEDASLGAGDESGEGHAFDHQVRKVAENETILDGARLALIGVADDVADGVGLLADQIPLHRGGKSRAAHALQLRFFQRGQQTIPILAGDEAAQNAVLFAVAIGIGSASNASFLRMFEVMMIVAHRLPGQVFDLVGIHMHMDFVVHCNGEGLIAASEAAYVFELHIFRAQAGKTAQEFRAKFTGAVQMATHVVAEANFGFGGRR